MIIFQWLSLPLPEIQCLHSVSFCSGHSSWKDGCKSQPSPLYTLQITIGHASSCSHRLICDINKLTLWLRVAMVKSWKRLILLAAHWHRMSLARNLFSGPHWVRKWNKTKCVLFPMGACHWTLAGVACLAKISGSHQPWLYRFQADQFSWCPQHYQLWLWPLVE